MLECLRSRDLPVLLAERYSRTQERERHLDAQHSRDSKHKRDGAFLTHGIT